VKPKSRDLFAILIREHEFRLLAFVRSCVADPAAADDLVQETFIAAWWQLARYDRARPFATWLRGIARKKIREYYRNCAIAGRHVKPIIAEMFDRIGDEHDSLTAASGDTFLDQVRPLHDCLAALAVDDRDILDRHYTTQQTCRAIAEHLGLRVEAIKKRLQRIREALRLCILGKLAKEAQRA
jgi:RNA polymerase sigma-70 factor (ECF subfamily)